MSHYVDMWGFPGGINGKEPAYQSRRLKRCRFNPWVGKIPWKRTWQPTQYSCLENPMDRGTWWATVYRVVKSWTRLKWLSMHTCIGVCNSVSIPHLVDVQVLSFFWLLLVMLLCESLFIVCVCVCVCFHFFWVFN